MSLHDSVFESFERKIKAASMINIEEGQIVIKSEDRWSYEIPLDECETVWGALEWLRHMSEKTWMTEEMLWRVAGLMSVNSRKKAGIGK